MPKLARPALPITGGCHCGAVRFEVSQMPLVLYACHCTECQRQSGSAFTLNGPVPVPAFRIVKGAPKGWQRTTASGANTTSYFCGDCGGRIYGKREGREVVTLRAGTFDDTSWLAPAAHFYVRSAQGWERLEAGEAECFETMPKDFAPLAAKYQAMFED